MTLLPIVDRELRVAARRWGTYGIRSVVAGIALVTWGVLAWSGYVGTGNAELSRRLFWVYGVFALVYALSAGVLFTADSLSAERREGTLGLLFLTPLKGAEIVLGKLAATSYQAVNTLLVLLPIMTLPLLMGGVSVQEICRLTAVVLSGLYYSLCLGLWVSTRCRHLTSALALTFVILVLQCALPWVIVFSVGALTRWAFQDAWWFLAFSPFASLGAVSDKTFTAVGPGTLNPAWVSFGLPILMSCLLGTMALVASCVSLPRGWRREHEPQDGPAAREKSATGAGREQMRRRHGNERRDQALLEANPCEWIACRFRRHLGWAGWGFGALFVVWLVTFLMLLVDRFYNTGGIVFALVGAFVLHFAVKVWLSAEASRRVAEEKKSGAFELLLVTPVRVRMVVAGELLALARQFMWPLTLTAGASGALILLIVFREYRYLTSPELHVLEIIAYGIVILFFDAWAIAAVAMAQGLRRRRQLRAVLSTFLRILLPPWIAVVLFYFLIAIGTGIPSRGFWFCARGWFVVCAALDLVVAHGALRRMRENFRADVAGGR